jgi:hypothetical protein
MKAFHMNACSAIAALLLFSGAGLPAQTVVAERTTTYSGTVSEYEPVRQTLIIRSDASAPITHHVTQATSIVDESGAPVRSETIATGVPVVVHSVREGDRRIASRIVVKRAVEAPSPVVERVTVVPGPARTVERETVERRVTVQPEVTQRKVTVVPEPLERTRTVTTTTATTGAGTITAYTPGMPTLVLRNDTTPQPVTYSVTKTTTFVDESGTPIEVERIGPGLPVTVHYVREGDHMLAERVVVTRDREEVRRVGKDEKERKRDRDDDDR